MFGSFLAGIDAAGIGPGQVHDAFANQVVEDQGVGLADQAGRLNRQKIRVARAGADEPDFAGSESVVFVHVVFVPLGGHPNPSFGACQ